MASYLSQLRKLKLQREPVAPVGQPASLPQKDNSAILRQLSSIVSNKNVDEAVLKEFFRLFSDEFRWSDATEDEIRDCKSALVDLVIGDSSLTTQVVRELLQHFRRFGGDNSKIDLCGQVFDGVVALKKRLRQILSESPVDELLEGDERNLLMAVLQHHPRCRDAMDAVEGVFPSVHLNPKYHGLRCFFYRRKDGKCVDFSYSRCADRVNTRGARYRDSICHVVIELCRLFPRVVDDVADLLPSVFPHYNLAIENILSVVRALLAISRHVHPLRAVVYRLIVKNMTIIDAEIKLADPSSFAEETFALMQAENFKEIAQKLRTGEIDISEAKEQLGASAQFKQMYENMRTDEDFDNMTQKLDSLMGVVFEELNTVIRANMNTPISEHAANTRLPSRVDNGAQVGGDDSSSDSDEENARPDSASSASEMSGVKQEYDPRDARVVRRASTGTYYPGGRGLAGRGVKSEAPRAKAVTTVADVIVSELFDIFEDIILPTQKCKYVQFLYMYVISYRTSWTHLFLQRMLLILYDEEAHSLRRQAAANYISSMVCRANFIQGQLVCSIVYYLFSMLGKFDYLLTHSNDSAGSSVASDVTPRSSNRFGESVNSRSMAQFGRFYSLLKDLLHIIGYHAGTIGASPRCKCFLQECSNSVCAFLESHLNPIGHMPEKVVEDAISATALVPNLRKLHMCLQKARDNLFSVESVGKKGFSPKFVESRFPFDTFVLYHSGYFIRDKYRTQTYSEQHIDAPAVMLKSEAVESSVIPQAYQSRNAPSPIVTLDNSSASNINTLEPKVERSSVVSACAHSHYSLADNSGYNTGSSATCDGESVSGDDGGRHEAPAPGSSAFSMQAITTNECPPIKEDTESLVEHGTDTRETAVGAARSLPDIAKTRLHKKHPRLWRTKAVELEPDYDFWDMSYATESSQHSDSDDDVSYIGSFKRLKSDRNVSGELPAFSERHCATNRDESSDNNQLIVIGIDQLDDFELSLSSSILVNAPRRASSRIFDLLTSTAAYKSAIINSAVTKNSHKHARENLLATQ
ncbi:RNA polymerase i specific transcription initiation factor rrn3 [Babesia caballi]|uniref:RNA polymerase i specific transcription initiation factor rrn3 n=1 Tax=Babesia caballi TaxID=5871 RepID=A0AAV4LXV6_BABCB|nr:RNA polymerase i specific transcription initiation factor rrn3 [Babesia caballi]